MEKSEATKNVDSLANFIKINNHIKINIHKEEETNNPIFMQLIDNLSNMGQNRIWADYFF